MKPLRTSKNIASNNYFVLIGQLWSIKYENRMILRPDKIKANVN